MDAKFGSVLGDRCEASESRLRLNPYPGRGLILGALDDGSPAAVYWIMGRSANSRNRHFVAEGREMRTEALDPSKVEDPSLIIYYPLRIAGDFAVISNGDQTDTVRDALGKNANAESFNAALRTRRYEHDAPNFTPRISGLLPLTAKGYRLSILKAAEGLPEHEQASFHEYSTSIPGYGHCIHTYADDGDPLPSFRGEPSLVRMKGSAAEILDYYWNCLNQEHRISMMFFHVHNGVPETRIINRFTRSQT